MRRAVIVQAKRTAIGKKGGILKDFPPEKLIAPVIQELVQNLPCPVDDILLGNAIGPGGNLARLSSLASGQDISTPGVTIDRQCGSGLEAIRLACHLIQGGAGDIFIAGGVESCSQSPFEGRARFSPENIGDPDMGIAADQTAQKYGITRKMQDEYALLSYQRALDALEKGYVHEEIISSQGLPPIDESPNPRINYHRLLKRLSPCFNKNGTITMGNCCGINDGAAAVLVMSEAKAIELGYRPVLRFVDSAVTGVDPNHPITGAVSAISSLLKKCDLTVQDIDLIELNEAFAAKAVLISRELSIPYEKINPKGGAIASGHPYGASGAILVTRLFYEVQRSLTKYCLSVIGIGGGMGVSMLWEYPQ
ncbi:acetyl-CoA acetyltransferase [Thalassobacillus devorans]|uniref:Acetyl-CoA acetyltransferase n=1 Tax=Thalassobacillus devorans TaxID=279813 RepID=A0ABQ1NIL5_9BACI|nr:acetyl-CoA C-acyltransferase [Thalassobacillus devorans]NIK27483.1 acetyl-CoA C-acetyltransferase [Thalassobacillus devorans]GGC78058.1 acetyl-CoA acetyltransferase [Thalassobacillus devorans]